MVFLIEGVPFSGFASRGYLGGRAKLIDACARSIGVSIFLTVSKYVLAGGAAYSILGREEMMAKIPENGGKPWTPGDVKKLEQLANQNTPTGVIGLKLKRAPEAVQQKASQEDISLKPTNQSPCNRRKK